MLDNKDTDVVRRWLETALAAGAKRGLTKSGLAEHCGVKPQAITGWLKTGRITKTNLTLAAQYLGTSPRFVDGAHQVEQVRGAIWPFESLASSDYFRLPMIEREKVETYARFIFEQWVQAGHRSTQGKTAA